VAGAVRQAVVTAAALFALGSLAVVAVQMQPTEVVRLRPPREAVRMPVVAGQDIRLVRALDGLHHHLQGQGEFPGATWESFALALRAFAECADAPPPSHPGAPAPERLRALAAHAQARARALDDLLPAFQALYRAMSPEQRSAADRLLGRDAPHLARVLRG
jgi:hypothetical protein